MANKAVEILLRARDAASEVISRVGQRVRDLGNNSKKAEPEVEGLGQSTANAAKGSDKLSSSLRRATTRLVAFVAAGLGLRKVTAYFTDILNTGGRFESLRVQLESVTGSAEAAEEAFAWIKDFTKNTPFQLNEVSEAFVRLRAFGLDPMDGTMQSLVDQASALGGGQETLRGIILAVGQAWAKQKLQGEEILQLVERGVPVWELLSNALGKNVIELQKLSERGELGRDAIKALIDEIGKGSFGAAAEQTRTWNGLLSNLKDTISETMDTIAQSGALDYFKEQLDGILQTTEQMAKDGRLQQYAQRISDAMINGAQAAKSFAQTVVSLAGELKLLASAFVVVKIGGFVQGLFAAAAGAGLATKAVNLLRVALLRSGIGAAAVAAGYLATKLLGVGKAAEESAEQIDKDIEKANALSESYDKISKELDEQKRLYEETGNQAAQTADEQTELANSFDLTAEKARLLAEATSESQRQAIEFVYAVDEMRNSADGLGKALQDLTDTEFTNFTQGLNEAIERGYIYTSDAIAVQNAVTAESFRRLNVDVELFGSGMTTAGLAAVEAFRVISSNADTSSKQIKVAFESALESVETKTAVNALKTEIQSLGDTGRLSAEDVAEAMEAINEKITLLNDGVSEVSMAVIREFAEIADAAETTGDQITSAINQALTRIDSKQGFQVLREELDRLYREGKISLNQLVSEVRKLEEAIEQTGDAVEIARQALGEIVSDFNAADTIAELNEVGQTAARAWQEGRISAEQYQATLDVIERKKRDVIAATLDQIAAERQLQEQNAQSAQQQVDVQDQLLASSSKQVIVYSNQRQQLRLSARELENMAKINAQIAEQQREVLALAQRAGTRDAMLRYFAEYNLIVTRSQLETDKANKAAAELADRISDIGEESLDSKAELNAYADELERAIENHTRLNETNFQNLQRALETVRSRIQDINNETRAAQDEMRALERELASLKGDEAEVQRLEYESRRLELIQKITEAEAEGNQQAVAHYQRALELLKQINALEQQRIAADSGQPYLGDQLPGSRVRVSDPADASSDVRVVTLQFSDPDGQTASVSAPESEVDNVISILRNAGARTQ
jgi:tape measure domain-containing protein